MREWHRCGHIRATLQAICPSEWAYRPARLVSEGRFCAATEDPFTECRI
jgi:hypothetical protein